MEGHMRQAIEISILLTNQIGAIGCFVLFWDTETEYRHYIIVVILKPYLRFLHNLQASLTLYIMWTFDDGVDQ